MERQRAPPKGREAENGSRGIDSRGRIPERLCRCHSRYAKEKRAEAAAGAGKKRHVICISDGCLEEIGEYATKERCLEVLDEIQKACVSYLFTAGGAAIVRGGMDVQPFAAVIPRLYEMPEK